MKEYYSFLNEFGNRLQGQMKKKGIYTRRISS